MRIALIAPFALEPKGTSLGRALPLASALARRGHQVLLVVPPWDNPAYSGRRIFLQGVPVWHPHLPPRLAPLWYPLVTWRTLRLALEWRPRVVHIFKPKAFSGLVAMALWVMKKAGLSSAGLVVDTDDWEGRGGWNELNPYGPLERAFFDFQEGWVLRHSSAVTAASRALCTMVGDLGVPPDRIVYLPNGAAGVQEPGPAGLEKPAPGSWGPAYPSVRGEARVPEPGPAGLEIPGQPALHEAAGGPGARAHRDAPLAPVAAPLPPVAGVALNPGNEERIGPTLLLYTRFFEFQAQRVVSIFRQVLAQVPQARLLVLGTGLKGEGRRLSRLAEEAGLLDRVEMAGWIKPGELPRYVRRAQVAIYPLDDTVVNRAKCPLKLVELMQAGLPVVADRVGQAGEYIEDGKSGLLVEASDEGAFAAQVVRLLQEPQLRRKLGQAARDRIMGQFHWDHLAEMAEKAYGL